MEADLGLAAETGQRADHLPREALVVEPPLAADHAVGVANQVRYAKRAEDVVGARPEGGVEGRPEAAREAAGAARHRDPGRVPREPRGVGTESLGQALNGVAVGPL